MTTADRDESHFKTTQPDQFDKKYGEVSGFLQTKATTITDAKFAGVEGVRTYILQTMRVPEQGDYLFVTMTGPEGYNRIWLPPAVMNAAVRQRESLTTIAKRRAGRARAAADKANGIVPGFMRDPESAEKARKARKARKPKRRKRKAAGA